MIDVAGKKKLHEIAVGDKPEGVTWIGNGPLAAVTVYREDLVVFVDTATGKVVKKLHGRRRTYGIVALRDGSQAYVTHEYPGTVSEIDLKERKVLREIPAGSMIRGIALSPDEKALYVTEFYTGVLHAVDLATGKVVDTWKGHSVDNLCPARGDPSAPAQGVPGPHPLHDRHHRRRPARSSRTSPSATSMPAATDNRRTSLAMDTFNGVYVVTNPWETALSPDGKKLYTIYAGTNDMNICDVIDDDYKEIERIGRARFAWARTRGHSRQPRRQDGVRLQHPRFRRDLLRWRTMRAARPGQGVRASRNRRNGCSGKSLFNTARPPLTSRRWIACVRAIPTATATAGSGKIPRACARRRR